MSQIIQESKYITIQEFIPQWTLVVEEMDIIGIKGDKARGDYCSEKGLHYMNSKSCLVGEGHGNSRSYHGYANPTGIGCKKCCSLSYSPAYYGLVLGGSYFKEFKQEFYNHMIKEHPEKMERN